ncbi:MULTISPECIES: M24 family metallopeptidase [Pantoea]|mgnify:CR=1 FL=1|uniref:M24 family metallopeptidase n=1 Tax=Pantoea TaxID=53335 RepID=UPI0016545152|nr:MULTISPECIES: M24 family metallopeptidase [Pantoea]
MRKLSLRSVVPPDFGVPETAPAIPPAIYEIRCRQAWHAAGRDWLVVYADREHLANIAFLSGFEPRFEEALLLLGPGGRRIVITGNESLSYVPRAGLSKIEVLLSQTMSLLGQDRTLRPDLVAVLRLAGMAAGQSAGLVGWKYLLAEEWQGPLPTFHASALVVDALRTVLGDAQALTDATRVLMHPETGLRAVVDAHQIAAQEWGAARASAAVWRIVTGARPGESELAAAARMGYAGEVMNTHMMFSSSRPGEGPVVGLASPGGRRLAEGDGVTTAVSYWGGLSSRAGLLATENARFTDIAKAYFNGLLTWYDAADIGVSGGELFGRVTDALAQGGLRPALNPGHLVGHDEWVNTPVRPGSTERIRSGMPFQVDVIPTPVADGWALNCEDAVTFADADLRLELSQAYPDVWRRIEARRRFMQQELGVGLRPSALPLSNTPLCLPPCWLAADQLLVCE